MNETITNIMVAIFGIIAVAAAIFGWRYENGPDENPKASEDKQKQKKK